MQPEKNLLESFEWVGEFWLEGNPDQRFPGVIAYNPNDGLVLTVVRKGSLHDLANKPTTIHGYTQEAGDLTLFGALSTGKMVAGTLTTKETLFCKAAILGITVPEDASWYGCIFSTNNLDDFCRPRVGAGRDEYSTTPVVASDLGGITLSLYKTATGTLIGGGLSSLLLLDETHADFKEELDSFAEDLAIKHGIGNQIAKARIGYEWRIEAQDKPISYETLINHVYVTCNLLSVLMLQPVKPSHLFLLTTKEPCADRPREKFPVILSMCLTDEEKLALRRKVHFQSLPTNLGRLGDFDSLARTWCDFAFDELNLVYSSMLSHINGEKGIPQTILLISAVEQWTAKYDGAPKEAGKYDWLFDQYCNDELRKRLENSIPIPRRSSETLGGLLSRVRGAVLHPKSSKPESRRSTVARVNGITLNNIGEVLFILLVIAIYRKIGVNEKSIEHLRENADRHIAVHHEY